VHKIFQPENTANSLGQLRMVLSEPIVQRQRQLAEAHGKHKRKEEHKIHD
ncbi:uncharacterized protein METZ01_LOCUS326595, partial [marine metagenome]